MQFQNTLILSDSTQVLLSMELHNAKKLSIYIQSEMHAFIINKNINISINNINLFFNHSVKVFPLKQSLIKLKLYYLSNSITSSFLFRFEKNRYNAKPKLNAKFV